MSANLFGDPQPDDEITIGGSTYFIERDADSVWLRKVGSKEPYQVGYSDSRHALLGPVNAGLECDCPDFMTRHAGTRSHGCKHLRALAARNLLPTRPAPEPAEEEAERWGEAFLENQARADYLGL